MAHKTSHKGAPDAEAVGEQYAYDQIASEYFGDWVRDQMLEASKLPPEGVLPLNTKEDALAIARNMLRQLEQDTRRDLRGDEISSLLGTDEVGREAHREFFEGFRKACDGSRDWLADELLRIKGEMGESRANEKRRPASTTDPDNSSYTLPASRWKTSQGAQRAGYDDGVNGRPRRAGFIGFPGSYNDGYDAGTQARSRRPKARGSQRRA